MKTTFGTDGTATDVSTSNPLPISDAGGSVTVDGAVTVSGTVAVSTARVRTTDSIAVAFQTDKIMNSLTAVTPVFLPVHANTSGNQTLLAAQGGSNKIRILAAFLIAAGAVTARLQSGAGGTDLLGQPQLTAQAGFVLPFNPVGWGETAANTLLNLNLNAGVYVDGTIVYAVVT